MRRNKVSPIPPPKNRILAGSNLHSGLHQKFVTKDNHDDSIYHSFRPVLIMSMVLGMTPLSNIWTTSSDELKFRSVSFQTLYSTIVVICLCFNTYIMISSYIYILQTQQDINDVVLGLTGPVFFIVNTLSVVQLINACRKLPDLLREWDKVATKLVKYLPSGVRRVHVSQQKVVAVTALLVTLAIGENTLHDLNLPIHLCRSYNGSYFQCFMMRGNPHFNDAFGHGVPISVFFYVVQKYANVAWNFHDIFIVVLAMAMTNNFKVLADYVRRRHSDIHTSKEWRRIRENHLDVIDLTEKLDNVVSLMILQSYAINLFFICLQISLAIRPIDRTTVQTTYFCFSLVHLVTRTCAITLASSYINEEAKTPLLYLFECPMVLYCTEVYRFTSHLMNIPIGLTGYQFFFVTRRIFLTLLSIIITYELILLKLA